MLPLPPTTILQISETSMSLLVHKTRANWRSDRQLPAANEYALINSRLLVSANIEISIAMIGPEEADAARVAESAVENLLRHRRRSRREDTVFIRVLLAQLRQLDDDSLFPPQRSRLPTISRANLTRKRNESTKNSDSFSTRKGPRVSRWREGRFETQALGKRAGTFGVGDKPRSTV